MQETWKPILGYEGLYEVSDFGRIRSLDRYVKYRYGERKISGKILADHKQKHGYKSICLSDATRKNKADRRKTFWVHRIVAEAFISNHNNLPQVNHKDEIKTNNLAKNLEWCSSEYNTNYGNRSEKQSKTRGTQIEQINPNGDIVKRWNSLRSIARNTEFSRDVITFAIKRSNGYYGGYKWVINNG